MKDFLDDAGNQVQAATAVYDGHNQNQQQQTNPKDQQIIDRLNRLPPQIIDESNIINLFQHYPTDLDLIQDSNSQLSWQSSG